MASLRRKPNSKFWIGCYTDASGQQRQRSTKTTKKTLATQTVIRWELAHQSKLTHDQARKVISDIYDDIRDHEKSEKLFSATIRAFIEKWLARKQGEVSSGTWKRYDGIATSFLTFLQARADEDINVVTKDDIVNFRNRVSEVSTPGNGNYYLKALRNLFGEAMRDSLRGDNPAIHVKLLKISIDPNKKTRRPFALDEFQRLLTTLSGEWYGMAFMGFYTGQRLGDIAWLRWRSITPDLYSISFRSQKTNRPIEVPVAPPLKEYLQGLPRGDPYDPVFPKASESKLSRNGESRELSAQFYAFLVAAKLAKKRSKRNTGRGHGAERKTTELSFHSLRHNATSMMKAAGVPESVVRDIIGHESELVSRDYTHISMEVKAAAISKLPDVRIRRE